jgi:hypothetical protein
MIEGSPDWIQSRSSEIDAPTQGARLEQFPFQEAEPRLPLFREHRADRLSRLSFDLAVEIERLVPQGVCQNGPDGALPLPMNLVRNTRMS